MTICTGSSMTRWSTNADQLFGSREHCIHPEVRDCTPHQKDGFSCPFSSEGKGALQTPSASSQVNRSRFCRRSPLSAHSSSERRLGFRSGRPVFCLCPGIPAWVTPSRSRALDCWAAPESLGHGVRVRTYPPRATRRALDARAISFAGFDAKASGETSRNGSTKWREFF